MFTGIIEAVGEVRAVRSQPAGRRLAVVAPRFWTGLSPGASVAVDGVCLTLVQTNGDCAEFDVVAETLRCSTLGERAPGDGVNLERSLAWGGRLDGHFVQGHVDTIATLSRVEQSAAEARRHFTLDPAWMKYLAPKGAIAVDGISLTIAGVSGREFCVALIPTTLQRTTLGRKQPGARVNIETDILARTVVNALECIAGTPQGLTLDRLRQQGFA